MPPVWMQALDQQLDLIRFWQSAQGLRYAEAVLDDLRRSPTGIVIGDWTAKDLVESEAERLNRGETYFINADMGDLTVGSCQSRTLVPQPIKDYHLPTPTGFAFFQQEVLLPYKDSFLPIKAVAWRHHVATVGEWPAGDRVLAVGLSFYASRDGSIKRGLLDADFKSLSKIDPTPGASPQFWLYETLAWPFDVDWYGEAFEGDEFEEELDRTGELRRFMAAFFAHLQTTVLVWNERQPTDKHTKKRAQRAGFLADVEKIRVITLRKKYNRTQDRDGDSGDGWAREWSHRWIRRGFWRNQFYPKAQVHRQIWIDQTVCGPEDKPLIVKDRVFYWKR
jgi:hypothetical protein